MWYRQIRKMLSLTADSDDPRPLFSRLLNEYPQNGAVSPLVSVFER